MAFNQGMLTLLMLALTILGSRSAFAQSSTAPKLRVVVLSDIENEPDDA